MLQLSIVWIPVRFGKPYYTRLELQQFQAADGGNEPDRAKRLTFQTQISEAIEVVTVDYANGRADSAILVATALLVSTGYVLDWKGSCLCS